MCYFITATLPPEADLDAVNAALGPFDRTFTPVDNRSVLDRLPGSYRFGYLTEDICDCGTLIGAGEAGLQPPEPFRPNARKVERLRAKGWSETKIERWIATKAEGWTKAAELRRSGNESLERWAASIRACLDTGATPSFGLLKHWFTGMLDAEPIEWSKCVVPAGSINAPYLAKVADDTLYVFEAR